MLRNRFTRALPVAALFAVISQEVFAQASGYTTAATAAAGEVTDAIGDVAPIMIAVVGLQVAWKVGKRLIRGLA